MKTSWFRIVQKSEKKSLKVREITMVSPYLHVKCCHLTNFFDMSCKIHVLKLNPNSPCFPCTPLMPYRRDQTFQTFQACRDRSLERVRCIPAFNSSKTGSTGEKRLAGVPAMKARSPVTFAAFSHGDRLQGRATTARKARQRAVGAVASWYTRRWSTSCVRASGHRTQGIIVIFATKRA